MSCGPGRNGCQSVRMFLWLMRLFLQLQASTAHNDLQGQKTVHQAYTRSCSSSEMLIWPKKRAYQRACRRTHQNGGIVDKGRWHTESALNARCIAKASNINMHHHHHQQQKSRHLRVMTWNIGGMAGGVSVSFLEYANTLNYDVILVQETKVPFSNTWSDDRWHFIHSDWSQECGGPHDDL